MLVFIYGGSGSGKSEYAEERCVRLSLGNDDRYYLATMKPEGSENQERINRHLKLREGKSFITIEQSKNISQCIKAINNPSDATLLLECMSNLVANEMFDEELISEKIIKEKIIKEIIFLKNKIKNLIIVSNNIYEDGIVYDEFTTEYLKALAGVNSELAGLADAVIEVVVGIPLVVK